MSNTYPDGPTLAERTGCANPGSGPAPAPRETNPNANAELAANPVVKFCKTCAHFTENQHAAAFPQCGHPKAFSETDLVTGTTDRLSCQRARLAFPDRCGPSGAWWVRK